MTTVLATHKLTMPAEWAPHEGCILLYPHNPQTFRLKLAQEQFNLVAQAIATKGNEEVHVLCHSEDDATKLCKQDFIREASMNNNSSKIHVHTCPSNDTWARDTAPTFCWGVTTRTTTTTATQSEDDPHLVGLDWEFNAYGGPKEGCYWPCDLDQKVASNICRTLDIVCQSVPLILEGGSIHTDGEGTILTTEECLLNPNRNPTKIKQDIESVLMNMLGATTVIWLPHGLDADEDTNGHIDNFCCFVRPGHVVLAWTDDKEGDTENWKRCREAHSILEHTKDSQGRSLTVHKLYLPPPLCYTKEEAKSLAVSGDTDDDGGDDSEIIMPRQAGEKMAASYINFYIANTAVIVPQFGCKESDSHAIETLTPLFPDRTVVGVPSREILLGGGNIHCITQQIPNRSSPPCIRS